jgi:hypothetical protein
MSLNIERVHVMERDASGRDILVKSNPYSRFVSSDGGAIAVQGGRFYSDGGGQPTIPYEDVPEWAWKAVRNMTPDGRIKVGLPADMDEIKEPEPVEEPTESAQKMGKSSEPKDKEPDKTLVDYVYGLDHSIDAHWTKAGLPDLNSIKEMVGKYVSRGEVEDSCPGYRRKES